MTATRRAARPAAERVAGGCSDFVVTALASVKAEPGIHGGVEDVDREADGEDGHRDHEKHPGGDRKVPLEERIVEQASDTGPTEDQLDEDGSARQERDVGADDR